MKHTYYKLLAVVAVAGAVAVPWILLQKHHERAASPNSGTQVSGPASSGNPNADRIHELKALEEELRKKPEHPPILFRMAQLSGELGRTAEAVGYLRRLLKVEPANNEARLELGRLLYETNDLQGSIAETSKILESDPKQVDALYNLGAIYANLNKPDTAREYWNRAVASDPASDSGKRSKESLLKLAPPATTGGWTHPSIPAAMATHQ
ncbi:MAG TPA: tetratricopeptide repeat protein [Bryobacteraceae bacterium]|nr:tetratricopeptide repeat protein [Bryobacteraceae bacterium]